jgi:hypothetical protein
MASVGPHCHGDGGRKRQTRNLTKTADAHSEYEVQGIHKRMGQFQKLTINLFLTLHGHNLHRQQRQLSKFLMR